MLCSLCSEGHPEDALYFTPPTLTSRYGKIQTYNEYLTFILILFLSFPFCSPYSAFYLTRIFLQII